MERKTSIAVGEAARARQRSWQWVVWLVATNYALLLGILNITRALGLQLDGLLLNIERYIHVSTGSEAHATQLLLSLFMVFIAYQLWLRKRAAILLLAVFLIADSLSDFISRISPVAAGLSFIFALVLLLALGEFPARPDPDSFRRFKVSLCVLAPLFVGYGIAGLYLMRNTLGINAKAYTLAYRATMVAVGAADALQFKGWGALYRDSLILLALIGLVYLTVLLFKPYREAAGRAAGDQRRARELVELYGSDSLSYFNLRRDTNLFFLSDEIFLTYKCVGSVAVVAGDPVGPTELVPEIMAKFGDFCRTRGWRMMSMGARGDLMNMYEEAGLSGFCLGEEAVIELNDFSLEGRQVRKLRQAVNKLERIGITMEFMFNAGIPPHVKHELRQLSADWRGGKPETGFAMGLGRLMSEEDPDCLLAIARDDDMKPIGLLYLTPVYPRIGYSMDLNRTKPGAPKNLTEFMMARTGLFLKDNGFTFMSLHFAAFSQHYRADRQMPGSPFIRAVARMSDHVFPIISLYNFDKKFLPAWKSRYILYQSLLDLPLVGFAAISAESALKLRRGEY